MNPIHAASRLLATVPPQGLSPDDSRRGIALIALVVLLGVLLVTTAGLLAVLSARRRRLRNARPRVRPATPDPWTESARRLQPAAVSDDEPDDEDH